MGQEIGHGVGIHPGTPTVGHMNTIILLGSSAVVTFTLLMIGSLLISAFNAELQRDGVTCNRCMDTGLSVGTALARSCPRGCSENHESPYWPLVNAYVR
jgi:hypothetical protein